VRCRNGVETSRRLVSRQESVNRLLYSYKLVTKNCISSNKKRERSVAIHIVRRAVLALFVVVLSGIGVAEAACHCDSKDPNSPCMGNSVSYSAGGRTIGFQFNCDGGACACGRFANDHDYWVAPPNPDGAVTITRMTPDSVGIGTSNLRHGAQLDPQNMADQGFHGEGVAHVMISPTHARTLRVPVTVNAKSLGRPAVIQKSISNDERCNTRDRVCLDYVETLTVLERPPGDVFRPPFYGTEKPMYPASSIDLSILPNLERVGSSMSWDEALAHVRHVWPAEYVSAQTGRQGMRARVNYGGVGRGYDGYVHVPQTRALMMLTAAPTNATDAAKKAQLARHIIQRGIDLYYIHKNGGDRDYGMIRNTAAGCGAWPALGGFNSNKLVPIVLAANLLGDTDWLAKINATLSTPEGRDCFAETSFIQPAQGIGKNIPLFGHMNTRAITRFCDNGSNNNCGSGWPSFDGLQDGGGGLSSCPTAYQQCCTHGPWLGSALTVWLIPQVRATFPANARHWLEYVERARRTGADAGTHFGSYCSKGNFHVTGWNSGYVHNNFFDVWRAYKACSDAGNCPGLPAVSNPPLPPKLRLDG
jgi:hypothetical protein